MPGCCAVGCTNRSEGGYSMKTFPKDPGRRSLWSSRVKRQNWTPTDNSSLCEVHFDDDQWQVKESGKRQLKRDAVPNLFHHSPIVCKRKPPIDRSVLESKKLKVDDEHADQEKKSDEQFFKEMTELKKELMAAHEVITKLREENKTLKLKLEVKANQLRRLKKSRDKKYREIFNEDQLEAIRRKSMAFKSWSPKTVEIALGLKFSCGIKGYENLLHLKLPYPSNRTLQRRLQNLKFRGGILHEVLQFLKIKVERFSTEQQKYCALLFDEMSITESIEYDQSTNSYFGEVTFPGQIGKANKALVFMLGGLATRWKQVIAYYFTNGKMDGLALKDIIMEILKETEKLGLYVVSITSDMASGNQAMWKEFGVTASRHKTNSKIVHPCDPSRNLNFIADVPHLLKNIKSSLLSNKYFIIPKAIKERHKLESSIVDSQHLKDLANYQENMELKPAPKLTVDKLNDNHFEKMKVSRATSVLSHDVSAALKLLASEHGDRSALTTSWFLKTIDKWFNLMTSRHPITALSTFKSDRYLESITFLEEVVDLFQHLKIIDGKNKAKWKPIQTGVILSTTAVLDLQNELLGETRFHFLQTSRFSQDAIENLFCLIRSKQVIPTALQFKNNLKLVSVAQYLKTCTGSYDDDEGSFLSGILNLNENILLKKENPEIILPPNWDMLPTNLTSVETNSLYNIAGYLMSSIQMTNSTCATCFNFVATKERNDSACAKLVRLKQYKDSTLFFVKEEIFYSLFYELELLFRSLQPFLLKMRKCSDFIKTKVAEHKEIGSTKIPECHSLKQKIINRFVTFRLKIFASKKNRELSK